MTSAKEGSQFSLVKPREAAAEECQLALEYRKHDEDDVINGEEIT
jgi:hypothetical protein